PTAPFAPRSSRTCPCAGAADPSTRGTRACPSTDSGGPCPSDGDKRRKFPIDSLCSPYSATGSPGKRLSHMMGVQESSHSPKIRQTTADRQGVALACAGVVAAYCLVLRRYGLELADEGVLLAQMDRVVHGQVPYRDFHTGYGPGIFWLHAWAFAWFGGSLGTVRAGLTVVHAARAMLLARVAGAAGGRAWSGAAALALLAFFLPVAPGLCAPGNIPYPAR